MCYNRSVIMVVYTDRTGGGAVPHYKRIRSINVHVFMRMQCNLYELAQQYLWLCYDEIAANRNQNCTACRTVGSNVRYKW